MNLDKTIMTRKEAMNLLGSPIVDVVGDVADETKLVDDQVMSIQLENGVEIKLVTQKFDCGAYSREIYLIDTSGVENLIFANSMDGCWQRGHQRETQVNVSKPVMNVIRQKVEQSYDFIEESSVG